MSKKANSIAVTIRLKPIIIGHALEGLKNYNRNFYPESLSKIIKEVFMIGFGELSSMRKDNEISFETIKSLTSLSERIFLTEKGLESSEGSEKIAKSSSKTLREKQLEQAANSFFDEKLKKDKKAERNERNERNDCEEFQTESIKSTPDVLDFDKMMKEIAERMKDGKEEKND